MLSGLRVKKRFTQGGQGENKHMALAITLPMSLVFGCQSRPGGTPNRNYGQRRTERQRSAAKNKQKTFEALLVGKSSHSSVVRVVVCDGHPCSVTIRVIVFIHHLKSFPGDSDGLNVRACGTASAYTRPRLIPSNRAHLPCSRRQKNCFHLSSGTTEHKVIV